jgi:hypothetical protein
VQAAAPEAGQPAARGPAAPGPPPSATRQIAHEPLPNPLAASSLRQAAQPGTQGSQMSSDGALAMPLQPQQPAAAAAPNPHRPVVTSIPPPPTPPAVTVTAAHLPASQSSHPASSALRSALGARPPPAPPLPSPGRPARLNEQLKEQAATTARLASPAAAAEFTDTQASTQDVLPTQAPMPASQQQVRCCLCRVLYHCVINPMPAGCSIAH